MTHRGPGSSRWPIGLGSTASCSQAGGVIRWTPARRRSCAKPVECSSWPSGRWVLRARQVGAVDVERGDLVLAGREFGPRPLGAGLPDLVGALGGLLLEDVGDPGVGDHVVAGALAGLVQQAHRVRDRPLQQRGARGFDVALVLGERGVHRFVDQVGRPGRLLERPPARGRAFPVGRTGRACCTRLLGLGRWRGGRGLRGFGGCCLAVGGVQVLSEPRHALLGGTAAQYARLGHGEQLHLVLVLAGFRRRHGGDGRRSSA